MLGEDNKCSNKVFNSSSGEEGMRRYTNRYVYVSYFYPYRYMGGGLWVYGSTEYVRSNLMRDQQLPVHQSGTRVEPTSTHLNLVMPKTVQSRGKNITS